MEDVDQGYADERFTRAVDEDLHCAICLNILKQPMQCQMNEHHFCKPCITRHLENSHTCPSCKHELTLETLGKPSRFLMKTLNQLTIRCEYVDRGCDELVQLENLESHVLNCDHGPVVCSNDGCNEIVNKREKDHHKKEACPFRIIHVKAFNYDAIRKERDELKIRLEEMNIRFPCKKEDIIVAGGRNVPNGSSRLKTVEIFSWSEKRWRQLRPMRECRSSSTSVLYEDQLLVIGGYNGEVNLDSMETINTNQVEGEWLNFPAKLLEKRGAHEAVVYKDRLFVIGGQVVNANTYRDIHEVLLIPPYSSRVVTKMEKERCFFGAALIGNMIFTVGGTTTGDCKDTTNAVEMYDIIKNELKPMLPLPFPVCRMATVVWRDSVIVIGGVNKNDRRLNTVFMYDLNGKSKMLPPMKHKRHGCTAVITGNVMVVMGGINEEEGYLSSAEYFNFDNYSWQDLPSMFEPRCHATAVVKPAV